jgi:hypothetical protein
MKKTLKMLAAVVCAALTLSLTGCTKDNEDLIVGTWNVVSETMIVSGSPIAEENGTFTEQIPEGYTMSMTFNKDNTGAITESEGDHTESEPFTYTVAGDILNIIYEEEPGSSYGYSVRINIEKLDKKELILSMTEKIIHEAYDDDNGEIQEYECTETIKINMKRA